MTCKSSGHSRPQHTRAKKVSNVNATPHQNNITTGATVNGRAVVVPRTVMTGDRPGPTLTVTAGQHGRELNGVEAVRRLRNWLTGQPLRGVVQLLPVVNPPALAALRQVVPGETQNINRIWPGDAQGTLTERIAAAVAPHIAQGDYLVDLHGWSDWTVNTVLTGSRDDTRVMDIARAFGLPFVFCNADGFQDGNLKTFAKQNNVIAIGVELTPQWRLNESSVEMGVRGLRNVLYHLGMLDGEIERAPTQWVYDTHTPHEGVFAQQAGLWVQSATVGQSVREGDSLGTLYDLHTLDAVQTVAAPLDGIAVNLGPTFAETSIESNIVTQNAMLAEVWQAELLKD